MIEAHVGDTTVGLSAIVTRNGVAQTGETITAKIGDADVADSFLDFNDDTFKASAWTTKSLTLTEDSSESGCYKSVWDSSSAITTERRLFVLYEIASGDNASLDKEELIFTKNPLEELLTDFDSTSGSLAEALSKMRKFLLNRKQLQNGSSGNWIYYEDDDLTPAGTSSVTDISGNPINLPNSISIGQQTRFT